jgi:hypothetical protein
VFDLSLVNIKLFFSFSIISYCKFRLSFLSLPSFSFANTELTSKYSEVIRAKPLGLYSQSDKILMKNSIFWDTTPHNSLRVNRRFGGICRLHIQGRKTRQTRNQRESGSKHNKILLVATTLKAGFRPSPTRFGPTFPVVNHTNCETALPHIFAFMMPCWATGTICIYLTYWNFLPQVYLP